ncbi:mitochondrial inner membrane protease subunit 2-like isoform X2 [Pomacea canaliculata]|nr:mitochondrial inner membrane protease subunit 2-like isoform X2 [Pomacea canaliculata]XP_025106254.1 mitochondrial inner membrane protease subunit 2-like isoform X2 [Pomacea canaliculata]
MGLMGAITKTVFFAVPVSATFFDLFGTVVAVEGVSMQPALNPEDNGKLNTDYVFLNRWSANGLQFQRGEIVSLVSPSNPSQRYIKRIVALEGDTIKTLSYKHKLVLVPSGHCWVEGDHHGRSVDSNFFGPISMGMITGKARYIVWPPHRWGRLEVQEPDSDRVYQSRACFCD